MVALKLALWTLTRSEPKEWAMKQSSGQTKKSRQSDQKRVSAPPQVSVVIVNFETGDLLSEVVATVFSSNIQPLECIIVDNASRDTSIEVLRNRIDDPRLKILEMDANLGFAAGCNRGISESCGNFVLILNPDCILDRNALGELAQAIDEDEDAGAAGPLILNLDGTEQRGCRRDIPTPWQIFCVGVGLHRLMPNHPRFRTFNKTTSKLPDEPVHVEGVSGACILMTREAIDLVGLFDERYFLHFEDLDWCIRAMSTKLAILFVPHAIAHHVGGVSGRNRRFRVEAHKHASLIRFVHANFAQYYPSAFIAFVSLIVCFRFFAVAIRSLMLGPSQNDKGWETLFADSARTSGQSDNLRENMAANEEI